MKLPQLTPRELFLLVVIAAMGCGWWVERSGNAALRAESKQLRAVLSAHDEALANSGYSLLKYYNNGVGPIWIIQRTDGAAP